MEAGDIVRQARQRAGLKQRELGSRAGLPQSAVSAYEAGRVQPSVATLRRLVEAAGFGLRMTLVDQPTLTARPFTGPVGVRLQRHRSELRSWLNDQGFRNVEVFGSVARGDDGPESDVDLLVDIPRDIGLVLLAGASREASRLIGAPVDLVPRDGLKPPVAAAIAGDLVAL